MLDSPNFQAFVGVLIVTSCKVASLINASAKLMLCWIDERVLRIPAGGRLIAKSKHLLNLNSVSPTSTIL